MNPVVHFEMPYQDPERVARFYRTAFKWDMQALGPSMGDYFLATTAETKDGRPTQPGQINGGFYPRKADWPQQYPSIVIAVDDIGKAMQAVAQAGGVVLGEPMQIPGVGSYVSFVDTEGNRASMLEPMARQQG